MIKLTRISDLPNVQAVYAMHGGRGRPKHIAYFGLGTKLRGRIEQHLVRRDSSVTTGVSVVSLNPDFVTEVRWWEHTDRAKQLYQDEAFRERMKSVFSGDATGCLQIPSLSQALDKIAELEKRIRQIEATLPGQQ